MRTSTQESGIRETSLLSGHNLPFPTWSRLDIQKISNRLSRLFKRNPTMMAGIIIVGLMAMVAFAAPLLCPKDPLDIDTYRRLLPLSLQDWLGTDQLGRDVYARTIYGSRVSMLVGLYVSVATTTVGTVIGLITGYYRLVDMIVMRIVDGVMSIPGLLLAIALMALFGASIKNVVIALTITSTPPTVRLIRAQVLSLRDHAFVEAARAIGAGPTRILSKHIFPQTIAPLIVQATYICATAILVEAALSFLGAGSPPSVPSWGNMMAEGRMYLRTAAWIVLYPGLFLTFTVIGINLAGDGLRDILDPKLKHRI